MPRRLVALVLAASAAASGCANDSRDHVAHGAGVGVTANDPGPGGIRFTASGEALAVQGYGFPPASADHVAFVDGWDVRFAKVLVTFDHIVISESPDQVPTDPSQTGPVVAEVDGPWALDLHAGGPLQGKGGSGEQALPFASVSSQNRNGDAPFDATVRYAFGFDVVPATGAAQRVNVAADDPDYAEMIAQGYTVLYVGTATFAGGSRCTSPTTGYDFSKLPAVVSFRLGFRSPATYVNCQNPDNDPARPLGDEEHERGVQVKDNASVVAQLTIHTDHPFWESVVHDAPLHFDPVAARFVGATGTPTATLDDMAGVDFTAFTDAHGDALPWRSCVDTYTARSGTMGFDAQSVAVNPAAPPDRALRDYRDFMTYDQSTQGHLNSDGLCFVRRNYPSPR